MRARFVLRARVKAGREDDLVQAYDGMHRRVSQGVPGHIAHQLCQSVDDPLEWIVTAEWEDLDSCLAFNRSDEHRQLIAPLRECFEEGAAAQYVVRVDSRH